MKGRRVYPDEPAGPFPSPPRTVTDGEGREVRLRVVGGGADAGDDTLSTEAVREGLVEMYVDFDPADRAQGLPPTGERRVDDWIDELLAGGACNVVATVGSAVVGHAVLVPDEGAHELAIFVHHEYQEAGIGTDLLRTLLGHAADRGIDRVWLTVERWNAAAVHIYEKVGFEVANAESFELEMAIRLAVESDDD